VTENGRSKKPGTSSSKAGLSTVGGGGDSTGVWNERKGIYRSLTLLGKGGGKC